MTSTNPPGNFAQESDTVSHRRIAGPTENPLIIADPIAPTIIYRSTLFGLVKREHRHVFKVGELERSRSTHTAFLRRSVRHLVKGKYLKAFPIRWTYGTICRRHLCSPGSKLTCKVAPSLSQCTLQNVAPETGTSALLSSIECLHEG